jgi:hypothetical protein
VRRRTEDIVARRSIVLTKPTPKSVPALAFSGSRSPGVGGRAGGDARRRGVQYEFGRSDFPCPLHHAPATASPAAVTASVVHILWRVGRVGDPRRASLMVDPDAVFVSLAQAMSRSTFGRRD